MIGWGCVCGRGCRIGVCDIDLFQMGGGLLCGQVGLEGVAYVPSLVEEWWVLVLDGSDFVVAGVVVPLGQFVEDEMCLRGQLECGCAEVVVDVDVFVVEGVGGVRQLQGLCFSVPLLENVHEEVELLALLEEWVGVKLTQLKLWEVSAHEKLFDFVCGVAGVRHDCLQRSAHFLQNIIFHRKILAWWVALLFATILLSLMQAQTSQTLPEVFLFVNDLSGDRLGRKLLELNSDYNFRVPRSQRFEDQGNLVPIKVHLFNMRDQGRRSEGLQQVATLGSFDLPVILVVCGGDGSVMWMVTQMAHHHIDLEKVPIAIIPLGTGNSLSRVMGWGQKSPDLLSDDFAKLKKRISYWLSAEWQNLDIWMIEAEVQQHGKFQRVEERQPMVLQGKNLSKHFCSYFSIGIDGKIGYSFDLHRTGYRLGNQAVYGAMGLIKSFSKTKTLGELIEQFRGCRDERINGQQSFGKGSKECKGNNHQEVIFQRGGEMMQLLKDNQNLLAININSFMGGVEDVWTNAKESSNLRRSNFRPPSHKDGIIEIVSFGGAWSLAQQKAIGGAAVKVHQGSGPYQLLFKLYPEGQKHRTYFQVDGEHYRFSHPKRVIIKKSSLTKTSQIKVLRRVMVDSEKNCCRCL